MQTIRKRNKLFIFNPTCELAIANGNSSWLPNKHLRQFEKDLEYLPIVFASAQDFMAVHQKPSETFKKWLNIIIDKQPVFVDRSKLTEEIKNYGFFPEELHPWGWSPAIHHKLKDLMPFTCKDFQASANAQWNSSSKDFYSRLTALKLLTTIVNQNPQQKLLPHEYHPVIAKSTQEVEQQFKKWPQLVLKAPWSASGRGIQILRYGYLNKSNCQWINSVLEQQGYIMAEPLLDKLMDFSLHFYVRREGIDYVGYGQFTTNANGQYEQNIIKPDFAQAQNRVTIDMLAQWIKNAMIQNNINNYYSGFAGVDLMHIKINGDTFIHPVVEVNWRYNMGLVALQLERFIHPATKGTFHVHVSPKKKFSELHKKHIIDYPLVMRESLPYSGYFPLSDPEKAISGAYFLLNPALP